VKHQAGERLGVAIEEGRWFSAGDAVD
jgi:hypothetical protein